MITEQQVGTGPRWRLPRRELLHRRSSYLNMRALRGGAPLNNRDPRTRLHRLNQYLERNFPDFFAEARFQIGDDDYFLYARFGQYLAHTIEQDRASREKIQRGFTVLNRMARMSARYPHIRQMLISGALEFIVDAPKARALALQQLSPVAQGYLASLCE